ncbi:ATP-binding cassette domain-containing protein [Pseudoalteromonas spongiae]|uniref:ATP-binding cassette domain-containing protein n=1 Tax=Pseudoalteromonas spongiae TaxID=298657 RepID=UPI00110A8B3C|nr:ATP-binding cassette domain-containing protein [Pseudoalteromonas spongiae]TMO87129.1 hypothetical protein CWC15_04390 [Pseudoalteromonas spongiae]
MTAPISLSINDLLLNPFNGFTVKVSELSLSPGFYHLLGANGAGKSTLLDCIAGLYSEVYGAITISGSGYSSLSLQQLAHKRAYLTQQNQAHFSITGYEMLAICFDSEIESLKVLLENNAVVGGLEVADLLEKPLQFLSGGERQRCYLTATLLGCDEKLKPQANLLLLDEPFTGLDIKHTLWLIDYLEHISSRICVLSSHHEVNFALKSQNPCLLMKKGSLIGEFKAGRDIKISNLVDCFGLNSSQISYENNAYYQISWN